MKISFVPDNKVEAKDAFPRLKLKVGEVARIIYLETPEFEFTHLLRAPELDDDGKPVMKWIEPRKGGDMIEVNALEWIGRPICLGDPEKIKVRGYDGDACPICAEAAKDSHFPKPERRFAMHIAQYATKPGSAEVQDPFSVQIKVWSFGDKIFNQLSDFIYQDGWDPLTDYDMKLGPCEAPEMFQKFPINMLKISEWSQSKERQKYVKDAYESNKAPDLSTICGRRVDHKFMIDDIATIKERWAIASGEKLASKDEKSRATVSNILNGTGRKTAAKASEPEAEDPEPVKGKIAPVTFSSDEEDAEPVEKDSVPTPTAMRFQDLVNKL